MNKNQWFKDIYGTIYTIGDYSGFYSSLKDKMWANGGHFEFLSKDKETDNIHHVRIKCIFKSNDL